MTSQEVATVEVQMKTGPQNNRLHLPDESRESLCRRRIWLRCTSFTGRCAESYRSISGITGKIKEKAMKTQSFFTSTHLVHPCTGLAVAMYPGQSPHTVRAAIQATPTLVYYFRISLLSYGSAVEEPTTKKKNFT